MKWKELTLGCLALLILCTCVVAGVQATELYAEPDAMLDELTDSTTAESLQPLFKAPWEGQKRITQGTNNTDFSHTEHTNPDTGAKWDNTYALDIASLTSGEYFDVLAPYDGTVCLIDKEGTKFPVSGKMVVIEHTFEGRSYKTVYLHLSEIYVENGSKLEQGEVFAKSGNTGTSSTGPHLHFHLFKDEGNSENSHTRPIERLVLKKIGEDDDFRVYNQTNGDLKESILKVKDNRIFESNNIPIRPKLHTEPATSITSTSAVLHGNLTGGEEGKTYNVCFRYEGGNVGKTMVGHTTVGADSPSYEYTLTGLEPGTTYHYRAVHNDSLGPGEPHVMDADEFKSFTIPGATISAKIPEDLLDNISKKVDSLDYIDNWEISRDQFKIMLAALAWGEGNVDGYAEYAAHSSDNESHCDKWHKDLPGVFRFSGGLGPFQITVTEFNENWTTLDKLNSTKALNETINRHKQRIGENFEDLEDVRSKLMGQWYAYQTDPKLGHWVDTWYQATGTEWDDVKHTNKTTPNSPLDWEAIKERVKYDEKESEEIKNIGEKKWTIRKEDNVKNYNDESIELNKDLDTWFIKAKSRSAGRFEYYYTYDDDQKIEIWAYSNSDDRIHDKKSIFVRTYNKPEFQRFPDGNYTLTHLVLTDTSENANVVLVIDRSGSMSGSPISNAKNSANQFIDLMKSGDKAGVVSFSSSARYDYHLTDITDDGVKDDIKTKVDSIYATGSTAIGSGLRFALDDLLNYGNSNGNWAIVLLSDGFQNAGEKPDDVIPSIKDKDIPVYTIGLGSSVDEELLIRISDQTGGEYNAAPKEDDLHKIYSDIIAKIDDQKTTGKLTANMVTGDILSVPIKIDSSIKKATFSTSWPGSNVDLVLYRPDGSTVDPSVADTDPSIEYLSGPTYKIYKVTDPESGTWNMDLTATDMAAGGEDVYVTVRADSMLSMSLSTDKDQYNQGEAVKIVANFSDAETQIIGVDVNVSITLPDSSIEYLTLYDDGGHGDGDTQDGVYANYFVNTSLNGDYKVDATSTGSLPDGSQFTRIEDTSFKMIPGTCPILLSPENISIEGKAGEQVTGTIAVDTSSNSMWVSIIPMQLQSEDGNVIDTSNIKVDPASVQVSSGTPENILVTIEVPADVTPGNYTGEIVATGTGGSVICTIILNVTTGITEPTPATTSGDSSGGDSSLSTGSAIEGGGGASFSFAGLPVSMITVKSEADISRALFVAELMRSLPSSSTPPEPEIYQYLAITPYYLDDADFDEAIISFHVPVGYLSPMGMKTTDVALMRHVDGQWVRLKTTLIKEEAGKAYYEAITPGFSIFAIVLEKDGAKVATPALTPEPAKPTLTPEPATTTGEEERRTEVVEPQVSPTSTPALASAAAPTSEAAPLVYAPIGLVIVGLLVLALRRQE